MGVPSIRSAPFTYRTGPSGSPISIRSSSTQESPNGFGRNGERVANTPICSFPPSLGGLTVGCHSSPPAGTPPRRFAENSHISQMWENSSSPLTASLLRYMGSNTIRARRWPASPLCRGIPNFSENSVRICAIGFISISGAKFTNNSCR